MSLKSFRFLMVVGLALSVVLIMAALFFMPKGAKDLSMPSPTPTGTLEEISSGTTNGREHKLIPVEPGKESLFTMKFGSSGQVPEAFSRINKFLGNRIPFLPKPAKASLPTTMGRKLTEGEIFDTIWPPQYLSKLVSMERLTIQNGKLISSGGFPINKARVGTIVPKGNINWKIPENTPRVFRTDEDVYLALKSILNQDLANHWISQGQYANFTRGITIQLRALVDDQREQLLKYGAQTRVLPKDQRFVGGKTSGETMDDFLAGLHFVFGSIPEVGAAWVTGQVLVPNFTFATTSTSTILTASSTPFIIYDGTSRSVDICYKSDDSGSISSLAPGGGFTAFSTCCNCGLGVVCDPTDPTICSTGSVDDCGTLSQGCDIPKGCLNLTCDLTGFKYGFWDSISGLCGCS